MPRVLRPWIATLLFTAFMVPASEAGQVQVVARSGCDVIPYSMTPDARFVAVQTCTGHLFLVDRNGAPSALINHASGSPSPANAGARYPILSANGAFIAFRSTANNLVPGQTDSVGADNVFLYEKATGQNILISQRQSPGGPPANFFLAPPVISDDGRYVAFESDAHDLVPGQIDAPGTTDLFLYDRVAGSLILVSHAAGSTVTAANAQSLRAVLSDDGSFLVFSSHATNLISGQSDSNADSDIFLYDRASGTTTMISHASGSTTTTASGFSYSAEISGDGRYVAFASNAGNLVAGQVDPAVGLDVFLFDRIAGTTSVVSHQSGAPTTAGNKHSSRPSMSDDGRYIAFDSQASDLAAGTTDTPESLDTFVYDRASDTTILVSHAPGAPTVAASSSYFPRISGDGSFVAFISYYQHLPGQTNNMGMPDLFLFDRASAAIVLVTRSYLSPTQDANYGFYPFDRNEWFIDADGSQVVFASGASDLEPNDSGAVDVWAFDNGLQGHFYTVAPCRLLDTRTAGDGPALSSNVRRLFGMYGRCGIPVTAKTLALNVTIFQAPGSGHLTLYPGDAVAAPMTSTINFGPGQTRSNNAFATLASNADGTLALRPLFAGGGTVHVVLDVTGYFE